MREMVGYTYGGAEYHPETLFTVMEAAASTADHERRVP